MNKSPEPLHRGPEQDERSEKLAAYKQKATETIEAAKAEGAFDKPKEKLFLEIGANMRASMNDWDLIRAYQSGATVVTVDPPAELGKERGDTGFGAPGIYSMLLGTTVDITSMMGWGETVESSSSDYEPEQIKARYEDLTHYDSKREALDTSDSANYRLIKLCADGQDLSFFENDTFGKVIMEDVMSDPSIPEANLSVLVAEALRVGAELVLFNPTTTFIAAERFKYANLEAAGIEVGHNFRGSGSGGIDWERAARFVHLSKTDKFGEVPLTIPSYEEISRLEYQEKYNQKIAAEKAHAAERKRQRHERLVAQLAKLGLHKKA